MTEQEKIRLDELQTKVFEFINSIQDDDDRIWAAIDIVYQAITAGEHYFDEHKLILNEAGKQYRNVRKQILKEEGTWDEYQQENSIDKL